MIQLAGIPPSSMCIPIPHRVVGPDACHGRHPGQVVVRDHAEQMPFWRQNHLGGGGLIFPQAFIFGAKHFCFSLYNLVSLKSCKCVALGSGGTTHLELGGLPVAVVAVTTTGKQHEWSQVKHGITAAKDRDLNLVRSSTSYPHPANTNIADSPVNARKGQN